MSGFMDVFSEQVDCPANDGCLISYGEREAPFWIWIIDEAHIDKLNLFPFWSHLIFNEMQKQWMGDVRIKLIPKHSSRYLENKLYIKVVTSDDQISKTFHIYKLSLTRLEYL